MDREISAAIQTTGQLIGVVGCLEDTAWLVSLLENLLYAKENNRGTSREDSERLAVAKRCEVVVQNLVRALLELDSIPNLNSTAKMEDQSSFLQDLATHGKSALGNMTTNVLATLKMLCCAKPSLIVTHASTMACFLKPPDNGQLSLHDGRF